MKQRTWAIVLALVSGVALALWSNRWSSPPAAPLATPGMQPAARSPVAGAPAVSRPPAQPKSTAPVAPAAPPAANASPAVQALREVEALVGQGKIGAARDLAEAELKRIPDGPEAARIQSLTGVHPHR